MSRRQPPPWDEDLDRLAIMLRDLKAGRNVRLFVNDHFEGCAPLTIKRVEERIRADH